jgi:hypothetical protein
VENPFFLLSKVYKIIILCTAKLQNYSMFHGNLTAYRMLSGTPKRLAELQLAIKTGMFDRPTLSSAKWNTPSALLGLAD